MLRTETTEVHQCHSSVSWQNYVMLIIPSGASLVAQRVKHLPAMQETWVQSLGQEDPLEKETATSSHLLPWTEEPGGLQSRGLQRVGHGMGLM